MTEEINKKNKKQGERVAKVIARSGYCSRREAEKLIAEGSVKVNGKIINSPALDITDQSIKINNKLLKTKQPTRLWIFNKPKGIIVSHDDPSKRLSVFNLLPKTMPRVISIGRLNINTEGLLLLTNNGELAKYISHPTTQWTRRYKARVYGKIDESRFERLAKKGIMINGIKYAPIKIQIDKQGNANSWLTISLIEGKNQAIKKVLEYFGLQVNRLIRISFGPFHLGKLEIRGLKEISMKNLKELIGKNVKLK
jgi:23S rRNA pseudouridine2605 synthase